MASFLFLANLIEPFLMAVTLFLNLILKLPVKINRRQKILAAYRWITITSLIIPGGHLSKEKNKLRTSAINGIRLLSGKESKKESNCTLLNNNVLSVKKSPLQNDCRSATVSKLQFYWKSIIILLLHFCKW